MLSSHLKSRLSHESVKSSFETLDRRTSQSPPAQAVRLTIDELRLLIFDRMVKSRSSLQKSKINNHQSSIKLLSALSPLPPEALKRVESRWLIARKRSPPQNLFPSMFNVGRSMFDVPSLASNPSASLPTASRQPSVTSKHSTHDHLPTLLPASRLFEIHAEPTESGHDRMFYRLKSASATSTSTDSVAISALHRTSRSYNRLLNIPL